jgi:hypothetical protein
MDVTKAKHPYLTVLESQLKTAKLKKQLLENRINFLENKNLSESCHEYNEDQIIILDTKSQISALTRVIKEKEAYFIKFLEKFIEDCDEMESNFDRVKKEAYVKAETDPAIKDFLGRIFWDNLENNIESKVEFYKLIKQKL